jgi:hypothetical protein
MNHSIKRFLLKAGDLVKIQDDYPFSLAGQIVTVIRDVSSIKDSVAVLANDGHTYTVNSSIDWEITRALNKYKNVPNLDKFLKL